MKSTIKIALGSDNQPQINFNVSNDLDDMRDQVCRQFTERLQHSSVFCTVQCEGGYVDPNGGGSNWVIRPVGGVEELEALRLQLNETLSVIYQSQGDLKTVRLKENS